MKLPITMRYRLVNAEQEAKEATDLLGSAERLLYCIAKGCGYTGRNDRADVRHFFHTQQGTIQFDADVAFEGVIRDGAITTLGVICANAVRADKLPVFPAREPGPLAVGSVVRLKSGGKSFTVVSLSDFDLITVTDGMGPHLTAPKVAFDVIS